ncbi:MAG: hypothetical protein LBQ33_03070 [Oscillospiraceae bacterium]|jgi:hypothetical protein|nr:hypothetical protein [Oscillospiraceae bacterium]
MPVIDFHVQLLPQRIAGRAAGQLARMTAGSCVTTIAHRCERCATGAVL